MREVRVESLERLEITGGEIRILANSGDLSLVFPHLVWEKVLAEYSSPSEPSQSELEALMALKQVLKGAPTRTRGARSRSASPTPGRAATTPPCGAC